ncbi:Protein Y79H2A.3 g, partial [Aphelenchoides avenae]
NVRNKNLAAVLSEQEDDSVKKDIVLEYLQCVHIEYPAKMEVYDPIRACKVNCWGAAPKHLLHYLEIQPALRKNTCAVPPQLCRLNAALRATRLVIRQIKDNTLVLWCEDCRQCFSASIDTPGTIWTEHLLSPSHWERTATFAANRFNENYKRPEPSRFTVAPFVQPSDKKVAWKSGGVGCAYEFVFAQVGVSDVYQRNDFAKKKSDFFCTLCAVVIPLKEDDLEAHVRSVGHVFYYVNKYRSDAITDLEQALLETVDEEQKQRNIRRILARALKNAPTECGLIPVYDCAPSKEFKYREVKMALEKADEPFALEKRTKERLQHLIRNVEKPFYWLMLQGLGLLKRNESVIACGLPENLPPLEWEKRVMISHCEQPKPMPVVAQPKGPQAAAEKNASIGGSNMDIADSEPLEQTSMVGPRKLPLGPKTFGPAPPAQVATGAAVSTSNAPTRAERKRISPPPTEDAPGRATASEKPDHRKRKIISPPPRSPPRNAVHLKALGAGYRRLEPASGPVAVVPPPLANAHPDGAPCLHMTAIVLRVTLTSEECDALRVTPTREETAFRVTHTTEETARHATPTNEENGPRETYTIEENALLVTHMIEENVHRVTLTEVESAHREWSMSEESYSEVRIELVRLAFKPALRISADPLVILRSSGSGKSSVVRPLSSSTSYRHYAREPRAEERSARDTRSQREGSTESSGSDIVVLSQNFSAVNVLTTQKNGVLTRTVTLPKTESQGPERRGHSPPYEITPRQRDRRSSPRRSRSPTSHDRRDRGGNRKERSRSPSRDNRRQRSRSRGESPMELGRMMRTFQEISDDRDRLYDFGGPTDFTAPPTSVSAAGGAVALSDAALRAIPMLSSIPSLLSSSYAGSVTSTTQTTSAPLATSQSSSLPPLVDLPASLQSLLSFPGLLPDGTQLPVRTHVGTVDLTQPPPVTVAPPVLPPTNVPPPMFTVPPPTFNVPPPSLSMPPPSVPDVHEIMMLAKMEGYKKDLGKVTSISELIEYMWKQGFDDITPTDPPLLFNDVVKRRRGVVGVTHLYQIVCYAHPELETFYCGMCNHWTTVSEMFLHLHAPMHRLNYLHRNYKMYHRKAMDERDENERDVLLAKFADDIWRVEGSGTCTHRMRCILNKELFDRLWPDHMNYVDNSWKLIDETTPLPNTFAVDSASKAPRSESQHDRVPEEITRRGSPRIPMEITPSSAKADRSQWTDAIEREIDEILELTPRRKDADEPYRRSSARESATKERTPHDEYEKSRRYDRERSPPKPRRDSSPRRDRSDSKADNDRERRRERTPTRSTPSKAHGEHSVRSRSPPSGRRRSRSRSPRRRSRSASPKRRAPVGLTFSKGLLESVNKGASWDDKAAAFLEKIGAAPSAKMAFGSSTNGSGDAPPGTVDEQPPGCVPGAIRLRHAPAPVPFPKPPEPVVPPKPVPLASLAWMPPTSMPNVGTVNLCRPPPNMSVPPPSIGPSVDDRLKSMGSLHKTIASSRMEHDVIEILDDDEPPPNQRPNAEKRQPENDQSSSTPSKKKRPGPSNETSETVSLRRAVAAMVEIQSTYDKHGQLSQEKFAEICAEFGLSREEAFSHQVLAPALSVLVSPHPAPSKAGQAKPNDQTASTSTSNSGLNASALESLGLSSQVISKMLAKINGQPQQQGQDASGYYQSPTQAYLSSHPAQHGSYAAQQGYQQQPQQWTEGGMNYVYPGRDDPSYARRPRAEETLATAPVPLKSLVGPTSLSNPHAVKSK